MCNKCDISKCHAECCYFVPLSIEFLKKNKNKIVTPVIKLLKYGISKTMVYPITKISGYNKDIPIINKNEQRCPFLDKNNRCVVYDERPELCKIYGTSTEYDCETTCGYHIGKDYSFPKDLTSHWTSIKFATALHKYADRFINNKKLMEEMGLIN